MTNDRPAAYMSAKRYIDVATAMFALIILSPIMALIALAVRSQLGSPIFFRQPRPGQDEQIFQLVKFRTMRPVGPDDRPESESDADRITPFGALLRSTSLDELPTLWNVLRGDMSIVGPRPLLVSYLDRYTPEQRRRHEVRPGVTGLAQVSGRNALTWPEKLNLDVEYVDNVSFSGDFAIVAKTIVHVLQRKDITDSNGVTMAEFFGDAK
jgi:lipopolysaccharide/colanic/teichoic acid biosynthesis glycosyltransferase